MSLGSGMEEALAVYAEETYTLIEEIEAELLEIEGDLSRVTDDIVNSIFRAAHTIKGSSGIFGFDKVESFTHHVEAIFDLVRDHKLSLSNELIEHLLSANDHIKTLVDKTLNNEITDDDENKSLALISTLEQYSKCSSEPQPVIVESTSSDLTTISDNSETTEQIPPSPHHGNDYWQVQFKFADTIFEHGFDPIATLRFLKATCQTVANQMLFSRVPALDEINPEQSYFTTYSVLPNTAERTDIEDAFEFVLEGADFRLIPPHSNSEEYLSLINDLEGEDEALLGQMLVHSGALSESQLNKILQVQETLQEDNINKPLGELLVERQEVKPEIIDAALSKQVEIENKKRLTNTFVKVEAEKLDRLIDLVGEMVIAGAGTSLLAEKRADSELTESITQLESLMESVRDSSLQLRMVSIGETFKKFKRVIRDVSKDLGKNVDLILEGEETELDKTFVEKLGDPLMHLIRNCLDHGLETTEQRLESGKPAQGTLKLSAQNDSGSVLIEISDDGAGLNHEKILSKALEKGIISADDELSAHDINHLIFAPGFSTADQVSNLSGRGVGMDVVKRNVESLRGTIEVHSHQGKGTTFQLRLPLTLAIIDGFLFQSATCKYVVPLDMVAECIELNEFSALKVEQEKHIKLREHLLPCVDLRTVFPHLAPLEASTRPRNIMVVRFANTSVGLIVDELKGELQTVIKPIGKLYENVKCVAGATILGDGEIAVILDVAGLIKLITHSHTHTTTNELEEVACPTK